MANESKLPTVLLLMLMGIVILLMVAIAGLFIRMNELQSEVLAALEPFQRVGPEGLQVGVQAPDFSLADTQERAVSLADLKGQKVLLAFSSTSCPHCKEMYPYLRAFSEDHRDVQVVMISRGSVEENRQLVEGQGFDFPVLVWEDSVANDYQVPGTPYFYLIDGERFIVSKGGANSLEQLETLAKVNGR